MNTKILSPATALAAPAQGSRRVVDATTRMLHWLMALSFTGAYLTADGDRWQIVHVTLGYTLAGLVVCRLLWGLFGPRQVRLSVLLRKLQALPDWLRSLTTPQAAWRQGQSLVMAPLIALIVVLVLPLTLSGYAFWEEWGGHWLKHVHEFFGDAMLAVVLAHIALIAVLSLLRRKNQATPMLTGRVAGAGPDVAKRNHGLLAMVVLAGVLAFWAWQWREAPQSAAAHLSASAHNHHHIDNDDED